MSFDAIDRRRVSYCLAIHGLPYRFCGAVAPGTDVMAGTVYFGDSTTAREPVDLVAALLSVGPIEARVDDLQPVASQSPVECRIVATGVYTEAAVRVDPRDVLMRVAGPQSSTRKVRLLTTLSHAVALTDGVDVEVRKDASGWILPGVIHIGNEVLWADGYDGTGTDVDPYRFTGCVRAADGWASQEHAVDATRNEQPWATSDVTTWRGRRASIHVTALDASGAAIGWRCYWAGVLDSPPTWDGEAITVRVAPLTAVAGYKLGVGSAAREARSVAGAHMFRVGKCDRLALNIQADLDAKWFTVDAADGAGGTVDLIGISASRLDALGPISHARYAASFANGSVESTATGWTSPTIEFQAGADVPTACENAIIAGETPALHVYASFAQSMPLRVVDPTGDADQIVGWPARLLEVVNVPQAWQAVVACWADPSSGGAQSRVANASLARTPDGWALIAQMVDDAREGTSCAMTVSRGGQHCRAGWLFGESADDIKGAKLTRRDPARSFAFGDPVRSFESSTDAHRELHQGPSVWFYQSGEPSIGPFDADIYTGSGEPQQIEVVGYEYEPGKAVTMWIDGSTSGTHPETGDTVYWYTVRNPDNQRTVIQMEDEAPLAVRVVAAAYDVDVGEYLLRLLASGIGNGDNGLSDVMPIGANLPNVALSAAYYWQRIPAPPALQGQDYAAVRGKSIAEQAGGLMLACGIVLAQAYGVADDDWAIVPVHMSPADVRESELTLTDGDLVVRQGAEPVTTEIDGRTVRAYVVKVNYTAGNGKPEEIPIACTTEFNAAGSDSGEPLVIDLPGVEIVGAGGKMQAAAEIVADIRTRVGVPRVRWVLTIPADLPGALTIGIGSVVTLTSAYARGIDPTTTASGTACRVVGYRRDLDAGTMRLELRPFPAAVGGWAQSATVATTPDADTVTVNAADFSTDDASHFAAGDVVAIFAPGDWANRATKTIASVSGTTINFTAAHGASAGDIIRAESYSTVQASQQTQAYIADADGELGGGDPGQVIG